MEDSSWSESITFFIFLKRNKMNICQNPFQRKTATAKGNLAKSCCLESCYSLCCWYNVMHFICETQLLCVVYCSAQTGAGDRLFIHPSPRELKSCIIGCGFAHSFHSYSANRHCSASKLGHNRVVGHIQVQSIGTPCNRISSGSWAGKGHAPPETWRTIASQNRQD